MKSKRLLEQLYIASKIGITSKENEKILKDYYKVVLRDLNRLEQLEKAFDKACERLDYTCPVEEELVEDLDCDNCNDNCKECWKKYFMKEVIKDD